MAVEVLVSQSDSFGALLRQYRLAASLSQEALGDRAGLSANAIAALERGRRKAPRPTTLLQLAEALQLGSHERAVLIGAATHAQGREPVRDELTQSVPVPLTSFIGREQSLVDLRRLIASTRLLTLTGPGGVGKSRLAVEVISDVADVAFVQLASVSDTAAVASSVAVLLNVREQPGSTILKALATALRSRRLLLVLDNCEHVLGTCADLAVTLLQACRELRILATSREPLSVSGEVVWSVEGLSLPNLQSISPRALDESEAVQLFVERARAGSPTFAITDENAQALAKISVQLDGLPLAIELAAARMRALAPAQIAERLTDRFRLLSGGNRNAPPRHRSLQAAIDWSYDLLSRPEQLLLDRLAVFAGGWTLEGAEAVCAGEGIERADVLDLLSRLVDRSLVVADPEPGGTVRYRLLETIRQYAAERLERYAGRQAVLERHRAWYLELGELALEDYWHRRDLFGWWLRLTREQANFRKALRFSLDCGDAQIGLQMVVGLWVLWGFCGPWSEGRDWIARFLALPGAAEHLEARADGLTAAGQMAFEQGDAAAAQSLLAEAVDLQRQVGGQRGLAMALEHAGLAARARGEFASARAYHTEALAVGRSANNVGYSAVSLAALAHAVCLEGDYEAARKLAEESLAIVTAPHRSAHARADAIVPHYVLGRVALAIGDYGAARQHFETNLRLSREVGDVRSGPRVGALVALACTCLAEGDRAQARRLLEEALSRAETSGSGASLVRALEGFSMLASAEDEPEHALRMAGAAGAMRASLQHPISVADRMILEQWLEKSRRELAKEAAAEAWRAGAAFSMDEALMCARVPLR